MSERANNLTAFVGFILMDFIGGPVLGLGWVLGRDLQPNLGYADVYMPLAQKPYICLSFST
jgi:hypothetical protein